MSPRAISFFVASSRVAASDPETPGGPRPQPLPVLPLHPHAPQLEAAAANAPIGDVPRGRLWGIFFDAVRQRLGNTRPHLAVKIGNRAGGSGPGH
jgi:hypothetical protein